MEITRRPFIGNKFDIEDLEFLYYELLRFYENDESVIDYNLSNTELLNKYLNSAAL